jgi:uracil phosphoribosyltransferase
MLATGGSAKFALDIIKKRGAKHITMIFILCAPEGVKVLQKAHPDIKIYAASLDRQLNDQAFILPGLGDAGDRYFGI